MVDVDVNFELENEEPINANFEAQPDAVFNVDIKTETGTNEHDKLRHRDLPDQHPISAITDLQEILNKLWTYTYEQGIASATWEIQHNLGRHPSVVVVDSANSVIEPDVEYVDDNNIIVRFVGAMTGTAYLNQEK